jgi:O-antigen ligase
LLLRDILSYRFVNRTFTLACFAVPPILGSVTAVFFHGGAIWCTFEILSGRRKLNLDGPARAITGLIALFVLAHLTATLRSAGPTDDLWKMLPLLTLAAFPFSYSVWSISEKLAIARAVMLASAVACYGALLFALVQVYLLGMRAEGGAGNAIVFATVTSVAGSVSLSGALRAKGSAAGLLLGAFAAAAIAVVLSGTRSAWLVIAVMPALLIWLHRKQFPQWMTWRMGVLAAVFAVAAGLWLANSVSERVGELGDNWTQLVERGNYDTSFGMRLALWKIGFELIREEPVLGHGMGSTARLIRSGFREEFGLDHKNTHFHNGIITAAVEGGLIGALALAGLFVAMITNAWRTLRRSRDDIERFGAETLVILAVTYVTFGMTSILLGHDILDSVFMIHLIVGTYLASGRSMLDVSGRRPWPGGNVSGA